MVYCGHCSIPFPDDDIYPDEFYEGDGVEILKITFVCPSCRKINILLQYDNLNYPGKFPDSIFSIWPFLNTRKACPKEVPSHIAKDYEEACLVVPLSPKASAALSRRCLQNFLREVVGVKSSDLSHEIQDVIESGKLPIHLSASIDAIRNIGNFAAHPTKSASTGEIIDVESQEAEWNLDILESLFDFYYIQLPKNAQKRDALNAKLNKAGKPLMK